MKQESGITLISLVVTIIILIILAGVSIKLTLGENGIITIAKQAKENMELAQIEEETELNELYIKIEEESISSGSISDDAIEKLKEFKIKIAEAITNQGIETSENDTADIMAENIAKIKENSTESMTIKLKTYASTTTTTNQYSYGIMEIPNDNGEWKTITYVTQSGLTYWNVNYDASTVNNDISNNSNGNRNFTGTVDVSSSTTINIGVMRKLVEENVNGYLTFTLSK